jgi:Zn-dependent protease with chaperone function
VRRRASSWPWLAWSRRRKARREHTNGLTARLELLCAELSGELGIEPPPCSLWNTRRVYGGVRLGRRTLLRVSRGAMERLDPMALRWRVAHELGHLADADGRRRLRVARRVFVLTSVAVLLMAPHVPELVWWALAGPVALYNTVACVVVRRRLERAADRTAHRCCAADPDAARRALTAVRRSSGPLRPEPLFRLANAIAGYPPFDERIAPTGR